MVVCELPTLKIWKQLNKKQLRYDFWTLMAAVTFVWPLRAKAILFCELPTLKIWKVLNKKRLRYDFGL